MVSMPRLLLVRTSSSPNLSRTAYDVFKDYFANRFVATLPFSDYIKSVRVQTNLLKKASVVTIYQAVSVFTYILILTVAFEDIVLIEYLLFFFV